MESYAAFVDLSELVQFLQKQAKMAVFVILTVFALNIWTSEDVRLSVYIPTLQVNPGGRNDIIESYFLLGPIQRFYSKEYCRKTNGLGRNPSDLTRFKRVVSSNRRTGKQWK